LCKARKQFRAEGRRGAGFRDGGREWNGRGAFSGRRGGCENPAEGLLDKGSR
jgi:hypothetical protein